MYGDIYTSEQDVCASLVVIVVVVVVAGEFSRHKSSYGNQFLFGPVALSCSCNYVYVGFRGLGCGLWCSRFNRPCHPQIELPCPIRRKSKGKRGMGGGVGVGVGVLN